MGIEGQNPIKFQALLAFVYEFLDYCTQRRRKNSPSQSTRLSANTRMAACKGMACISSLSGYTSVPG